MSYPLPGETVTRTLRNVEFGRARPRDEPAPPEVAEAFRAMQDAFAEIGMLYEQWRSDPCHATYANCCNALDYYESMYASLLRRLRRCRDHCFVCDGCRFWLHTENHGCRVNVIRIEEI